MSAEKLAGALNKLAEMVPAPPNAITYDHGWKILDFVQKELRPLIAANGAQGVEERWVLVPKEYTDEMLDCAVMSMEAHKGLVGEHASMEALAGIAYDLMVDTATRATAREQTP